MSQFKGPLVVTPEPDGFRWALWLPFWYVSDLAGAIEVPQGFITDFASTPKEVWNVYPPWGKYGPAAIVHDWLYWTKTTTRDIADLVLKEAMQVCGCDELTIQNFYTAVHLFGEEAWEKDAKAKANGDTRSRTINHGLQN